jgi:hypothetical protein
VKLLFARLQLAASNRRSGQFATRRLTRTAAPHHEADLDVACAGSSAVLGSAARALLILSMISSEKSATFRDHALAAAS